MSIMFLIYAIELVDKIKVLAIVTLISFLIGFVSGFIVWSNEQDWAKEPRALSDCVKFLMPYRYLFVISIAYLIFIPSSATTYKMVGAQIITNVAENKDLKDDVKSIYDKALRVIGAKLDQAVDKDR